MNNIAAMNNPAFHEQASRAQQKKGEISKEWQGYKNVK
jgi:hypothetical protein